MRECFNKCKRHQYLISTCSDSVIWGPKNNERIKQIYSTRVKTESVTDQRLNGVSEWNKEKVSTKLRQGYFFITETLN